MERHVYINGVKVIKYEPDLNDNLKSLETAKRVREKLKKEIKPVKREVLEKQVSELLAQLENDFAL